LAFIFLAKEGLSLRLTNFAVACTPVALTIVIAFIPDLRRAPMKWRIGVVSIGLMWTLLIFKQEVLTENEQNRVITEAISRAVSKSNKHSEQEIGNQVQKLTGVFREGLGQVSNGLSHQMSNGLSTLNQNLSKVGQPPEPKFAQIQFSLWDEQFRDFPELVDTVERDSEGVFKVYWTGRNTSDVAAENLEFWIVLCDDCTYAREPEGFDRPPGTSDVVRHRMFGFLNPGVTIAKIEMDVRMNGHYGWFEMDVKYSCKTCGKMPANPQALTIKVPKLRIPSFPFPPKP